MDRFVNHEGEVFRALVDPTRSADRHITIQYDIGNISRALTNRPPPCKYPLRRTTRLDSTGDKLTSIKEPAMDRRHLTLPTFPLTRIRALAAAALLSIGCAGPTRIVLNDAQRDQLGSVRTVGAFSQQELRVSVVAATGGAAFGLIGAIINSSVTNSRAKDAEGAVVPVRNALVGYEPSGALGVALKRELGSLAWLKRNTVEILQPADSKTTIAELVKASKTDMVLLVQTDYRLTPEFDAMVITAKVFMLPCRPAAPARAQPADDEPAPKPDELKPVYLNIISTSAPLPGFTTGKTTMAEAAKLWAENGGKYARRALDGGIAELAKMIAFDLAQGGPPSATAAYDDPPDAKVLTAVGKYGMGTSSGFVVREENGRSWLRLHSGELGSVGELYP